MVDEQQRTTKPGLGEEEIRAAEAHRGFVREMDRSLGKAYGTGGAVVIGALFTVVAIAWSMGWWTEAMLWVPGITAVLATLYLVRRWIYAKRDRLRERVEKYCETNELQTKTLEQYYQSENMYPFFAAIFETRPQLASESRRAIES